MPNRWIAECTPCRWQEQFTDQDNALLAAEHHVLNSHAGLFLLPTNQRGARMANQCIGHVQLRDIDAAPVPSPETPAEPEAPKAEPAPPQTELPPAPLADPAPPTSVPDGTGDSTSPKE